MLFRRFISYFTPSPLPLTITWVALFEFVSISLVGLVIGIDQNNSALAIVLLMTTSAPLAVVLLTFGAYQERRWGARTLLWAIANLLLILMSLLAPFSGWGQNADSQQAVAGSVTILLLCCAPLWLLHAGVGIFCGFKAWPELSMILRAARYQRILEIVEVRGVSGFGEIAAEVDLPQVKLAALLQELIASGELMASLDLQGQRIYSAAALAEKQRRLLAVVQARGQISLADLAAELGAPLELVRQWVYHLAQRGQFHAYVDWNRALLYSPDVEGLARQNAGRCPHCGGELGLAGQGVVLCGYCGVEIFL